MVIHRSPLNVKINRNSEVFTATDFLAAISQHIPDKGAQMVRCYGWYSYTYEPCDDVDPTPDYENVLADREPLSSGRV
jgi:hypothetical protein